MKKQFLIALTFLFIAFKTNAKTLQIDEIIYKNSQIIVDGKTVAKYTSSIKDVNVSNKEKTTIYEVSIIKEDGKPLAKLDLQITENLKKSSSTIQQASLKTLTDNISHNSANFLEFATISSTEDEIPQFDRVIKYLIAYRYL